MALPSVAGLTPTATQTLVVSTLKAAGATAAAALAVVQGHPPDTTKSATSIGGALYLCGACSPGTSKVGWPCLPYRRAAGPYVTGLPEVPA